MFKSLKVYTITTLDTYPKLRYFHIGLLDYRITGLPFKTQVSQIFDRFLFFNRIYDINKGVFYHVTDIQSLLAE